MNSNMDQQFTSALPFGLSALSGIPQGLLTLVGLVIAFALLELALPRQGAAAPLAGRRYLTNFGLALSGGLVRFLVPLGSVAGATLAHSRGWGLFPWLAAQGAEPLASGWVMLASGIVAQSLLLYWMHRAMHGVPLLWRVHRVHHSDHALDLSTSFRHHPLETLLVLPGHFAVVVLLGLPVWVALLTDAVLLAGSLFKHLDGRLPHRAERFLSPVIATPTLHRVHHSTIPADTDSNFGNTLIIWDRLFGTFRPPVTAEGLALPLRIGLGDTHDGVADDLLGQLALPLRDPATRPKENRAAGNFTDM